MAGDIFSPFFRMVRLYVRLRLFFNTGVTNTRVSESSCFLIYRVISSKNSLYSKLKTAFLFIQGILQSLQTVDQICFLRCNNITYSLYLQLNLLLLPKIKRRPFQDATLIILLFSMVKFFTLFNFPAQLSNEEPPIFHTTVSFPCNMS